MTEQMRMEQWYKKRLRKEKGQAQASGFRQGFLYGVITVLLLIGIINGISFLWNNRTDVYAFEHTTIHVVERGDTLWNIAEEHSNHRHDTRQVVWIIQQINDTTATIMPNQILEIPIFSILTD